jgi:hypothetical protein
MKPKSSVQAVNPFEFIIKAQEGTSATEYQLLKLDEKGNRREFRASTGGIIHASGGAEKNALEFTPEKIAPRTWRIKLADLKKGEYGFLPPGVSSQSISSSGKIYTLEGWSKTELSREVLIPNDGADKGRAEMPDLTFLRRNKPAQLLGAVRTRRFASLLLKLVANASAELVHFAGNGAARLFAACWREQQAQPDSNSDAEQQRPRVPENAVIFAAYHI